MVCAPSVHHRKLVLPPLLLHRNPEFLLVALGGGLLGALLSFSSLWYVSRSSATVYSLTVSALGAWDLNATNVKHLHQGPSSAGQETRVPFQRAMNTL